MGGQSKRTQSPPEKPENKGLLKIVMEFFGQKITAEGPLGYVGSLLVGLIIGVGLILVAVSQYQEPSVLISPVISTAAAKTIAARPTPTMQPTVRVIDFSSEQEKHLQLGRYLLNPGEKVKFKIEPAVDKKYSWLIEPPDFGRLQGEILRGPDVTFTAPEKNDEDGAIIVCEYDPWAPSSECHPGAWTFVLHISTSTGP